MAKLSLILLASTVAFAGLSTPAAAQGNRERRSVAVEYRDLDLASADGRQRLATRVRFAVKKVCDSRTLDRNSLTERTAAQRCETAARADADVKLAALFNNDVKALADNGTIAIAATH